MTYRPSGFNHRGARLAPPEPVPEPIEEVRHVVTTCMWCDFHQGPYSDSDVDSQSMTVPVPKIENGVKVGIAYTVERHKCGDCVREESALVEKRRAISSGAVAAEATLKTAVQHAWRESDGSRSDLRL